MATLLTCLETALYMSYRLQLYLKYFLRLPNLVAASNFEEVLVRSYATILDFLSRAIHTFQRNSATRTFKSFWRFEDYDALEQKCKEMGQEADVDASICERELAAQDRQKFADQLREALREIEKLPEIRDSLNNLHDKLNFSRLPIAKGAAFDSYEGEQNTECLQGTRTKLLRDIADWINSSDGKPIYWINGMAGTGKSTISQTVARNLQKQHRLGASFFFKRDEADRSNASKLVTTLAFQLAANVLSIRHVIFDSLDRQADVLQKAPIDQFKDLIYAPLTSFPRHERTFMVIDALDECDNKDFRTIFFLLRQLSQTDASAHIRLLVTSRPDYPVLINFMKIKDAYQDMILHEIERSDIEADIDMYLGHHFQQLREDRSNLPLIQHLDPDWPGRDIHQKLVQRAVPLFIFAATICRMIADPTDDPNSQLLRILQQGAGLTQLEQTYMPVFQQLIHSTSRDVGSVAREFIDIIGPTITLADPLPAISMSRLFQINDKVISQRLSLLHSVLHVPKDPAMPVRTFHASFREFLIDPDRSQSPFWVNEQQTHEYLTTKCLELLNGPDRLRKDICDQRCLGVSRSDVRDKDISIAIPADVAYACRHLVYHVHKANQSLVDDGPVHQFLQTHLLHWIEALSWLGSLSSVVRFLSLLTNLANVGLISHYK